MAPAAGPVTAVVTLGVTMVIVLRAAGAMRWPCSAWRGEKSELRQAGVRNPAAPRQNEMVAVMDMVRGGPSHAAFSVIADR